MNALLGLSGFILFLAFGLAQLAAGFVGIANSFGTVWAIGAIIAALMFRFTLPITIGAFFGAMNVWGWHWFFAAIFAAPGLILIVPGTLASVFSLAKR